MNERSYRLVEKSEWGPGPWLDEPDKVVWVDDATDFDCMIVRNGGGALCGYVGVPEAHPWHGTSYGECRHPGCDESYCYEHSPEGRMDVHGGLTFAAPCTKGASEDEHHICHTARPDTGEVWWFGFDTAHAGDLCPAYSTRYGVERIGGYETYKTVDYVKAEVTSLAAQLKAVTS